MKRRNEIIKRLGEIRSLLEGDAQLTDEQINDAESELRSLEAELAQIDRRSQIAAGINDGTIESRAAQVNPITGVVPGEPAPAGEPTDTRRAQSSPEYRSAFFKHLQGRTLTATEQRALASADLPGVIPTQTEDEIVRKLKQIAPLLDEITLFQVPGNITIVVENEVSEADLHSENAEADAKDDTTVAVMLGGYELIKLIRISKTVALMSVKGFEAWLVDAISRGLGLKVEGYIAAGTGVNQPQGMKYARTWVDGTSGRAWAGVSLAAADLMATIGLLAAQFDGNAKFYMNKRTLWNNCMPIRDDSKAPIVKEDGKGGFIIFGYPAKLSDKYSDGEIYFGDGKAIYGNLAEGFTVDSSAESGFTKNAIDFRGTAIFDCKVAIPEAFVKCAASL
jgi:HK97 family phage major capsid protein